jgi:hypothetical protein
MASALNAHRNTNLLLPSDANGVPLSTSTTIVAPLGASHTHTVIFLYGREDFGEDLISRTSFSVMQLSVVIILYPYLKSLRI